MPRTQPLILAALLGGCVARATAPATSEAPQIAQPSIAELVAARQAGMHMAATLLYQDIAPRAKGTGDLKEVAFSEGLELWAAAIPGLFPPGSAHAQSRALPAIWANKPDFDRKAADMGEAARQVSAAGRAGDLAAYANAVGRLRQTCSACHTPYRAPQD